MEWLTSEWLSTWVLLLLQIAAVSISVVSILYYRHSRKDPLLHAHIPGPVPSVEAMLHIGKGLGHTMTLEAYESYMHHWDCFFSIDRFEEQYKKFIEELSALGLVEGKEVCAISIDEALVRVEELSWK